MAGTPIFSKLFGSSPISPIREHMETCEKTVLALTPFFEAVATADWTRAEHEYQVIAELEGEADQLKRTVRLSLPRSLFLPVPRNHLLEIIQVQDQIANGAKDIAGLMLGREMAFPAEVSQPFYEFYKASIDTVAIARNVIDELNTLVTTSFSGQVIDKVENLLEAIDVAEHESDIRQVGLRRALFEQEANMNPVNAVFLYQIIEKLGDIADDAQTVGNRMMNLIAS